MTIALRWQLQQHAFPNVSFGPFRFFEAMPWLVLAASMRVIAFNNPLIAIPAIVLASVAVLHAFLVVTQRSIELAQGQTSLGALDFTEQSRLTRAILWRIGLLMLAATIAVLAAGHTSFAPHLMKGLDGMAFDQFTDIGKFWSAAIAAVLVRMLVIGRAPCNFRDIPGSRNTGNDGLHHACRLQVDLQPARRSKRTSAALGLMKFECKQGVVNFRGRAPISTKPQAARQPRGKPDGKGRVPLRERGLCMTIYRLGSDPSLGASINGRASGRLRKRSWRSTGPGWPATAASAGP